MIITCKKEIPLRWIFFAVLPWAAFSYNGPVVGTAFLFSLKKFIENPAGLTFILSLPSVVSIVLGPCISFLSDRIWTRFGRRKPFVVASWTGMILSLALMPLMPNFWALVGAYLLYNLSADFNTPLEPLKLEIVPPHERVRATGAMTWFSSLATVTFYFIALGRFDDVSFMEGVPIVGESVIYWSGALLLSVMLLLIMLGIKELDQKSALRGQKLSFKNFFKEISDRELWPVYALVFSWVAFTSGLGPLANLLYTDQWGYSKQDMGINIAVGGIFNLFIIGFLTVFANRLNRMQAYQILICLSVTINALYFCYVTFLLPDQHPSLIEIITFGETGAIIGILTGMVYYPLAYDYIRRNKMGTYGAGAGIVYRLTSLLTLNGIGIFIWGYALLFQPPAGEMTRVVLHGEPSHQTEIRSLLQSANWTYPERNAPATSGKIDVHAWQANGTISDSGLCWEVRLSDGDSEKLADEKDHLEKEKSLLLSEEQILLDKVTTLMRKGKAEGVPRAEPKVSEQREQINVLTLRIDQIDAELNARAENFQRQVVKVLGNRLMKEGDQVLSAELREALVVELSTAKRPDIRALEQILHDLRLTHSDIIDLHPVKTDTGYGVVFSALIDSKSNDAASISRLQTIVENISVKYQQDLFASGSFPLSSRRQPVLMLDLKVVEEPIYTYVSPINRAANLVVGLFNHAPSPDHRLSAIARSLCIPSEINHVRIKPGDALRSISIAAVLPATAPKAATVDDLVGRRLQALLASAGGNNTNDAIAQARAFYDRIEKAAALQRLTVAHPLLIASYAPMKYNYMCGYIWVFILGLIGLTITLVFNRLEAKGYIRKRGIEEEQAS